MLELNELAALGLATYALSVWLTKKLGPWALFQKLRYWALRRRGFVLYTKGQLEEEGVLPQEIIDEITTINGQALIRKTPQEWTLPQADWVAAGLTCPTCASLTVATVLCALCVIGGILPAWGWSTMVALPLAVLGVAGVSTMINELIGAIR